MHFDELGSGPNTVVILHGTPTPPEAMLPLARHLAYEHRVLVAHLPGYGRSASQPATHALDPLIEAELVGRGIAEADVVGFSGGGYRALSLACRGGFVRVRRVVSLGGFAYLEPPEREGMAAFAGMLRGGASLDGMFAQRMLSRAFIEAQPEVAASVDAWMGAVSAENLAVELEGASACPDLRRRLGEIDTAVLARVGELDLAAPVAHSRAIASAALRGELQIVPGKGHALLVEDEADTMRAVASFLARA